MKMTFTATDARNAMFDYTKAEAARLIKTAEIAIDQMIQPSIEESAKMGWTMIQFHYHETQWKVYNQIRLILLENGFKATMTKEKILKVEW